MALLALCLAIFSATFTPLKLGDHLLSMGNPEEAITEYKRFIFFSDSPEEIKLGMMRISEAYRRMGRWDLAADALHDAIPFMRDRSEIAVARIRSALDMICAGGYSSAKFDLLEVLNSDADRSLKIRARFLLGVTGIYEGKRSQSAGDLIPSLREMGVDEGDISKLNRLLLTPPAGRRSPKTAAMLSTILPGAGQIYAGHLKDGINAFLLNGAILLWAWRELKSKDLKDGLLILTLILPRYYLGNIRKSRRLAESRNAQLELERSRRILEEIKGILEGEVSR